MKPCMVGLGILLGLNSAFGQGTTFTYQGRLQSGAGSAAGVFDFAFSLWTAASGPAQVGAHVPANGVWVSNGLFKVNLDFGALPFSGADRWLEISVRTNGVGGFTVLSPRQKVTATPYAMLAGTLSGPLPATQLSGAVVPAALPTGGNWALLSTLTLDGGTLAVDPVNNRVGVGQGGGGNLTVTAGAGVAVLGDASGAGFMGIGVEGDAGSPFGVGVLGRAPFSFAVGVRGEAEGTNSAGVIGEAKALSTEVWGVRGLAHAGAGAGVAGENDSTSGIGVYGLQGVGSGSRTPAGVYGESLQASGNGVVGVANSGPSAYGVWGRSSSGQGGVFEGAGYGVRALSSGTAGYFNNLTVIESDSTLAKPHLRLHETQDGDYARLELQAAGRPYWHLAVGGGAANQMNFYNSANGDVMSLKEDGTLHVRVLSVVGGADVAEPFPMSQPDLPKGAVVVIDDEHPGHLKLSVEPYDRRVAGIISGAGGVQTGLSLSQRGVMEGDRPVALTGRVYVQAEAGEAGNGPIRPGDLLTTSSTPGHAMKATEPARAQGATLGKAMTGLPAGRGLVLVLVSLQ